MSEDYGGSGAQAAMTHGMIAAPTPIPANMHNSPPAMIANNMVGQQMRTEMSDGNGAPLVGGSLNPHFITSGQRGMVGP